MINILSSSMDNFMSVLKIINYIINSPNIPKATPFLDDVIANNVSNGSKRLL